MRRLALGRESYPHYEQHWHVPVLMIAIVTEGFVRLGNRMIPVCLEQLSHQKEQLFQVKRNQEFAHDVRVPTLWGLMLA